MDTSSSSTRPCATLVVIEADDPAAWLEHEPAPQRAIVHLQRDAPEALLRCIARVQQWWPSTTLEFTIPQSRLLRRPAHTVLEYPWIDASLFELPTRDDSAPVTIGLHGPMSAEHDHPDDGTFYRAMLASGRQVFVPGTPKLQRAFQDDPRGARPALLGSDASIAALDIVVTRGDPRRSGWADARVLEAMAAGRAVVAHASSLGAREWIVDGVSGFVVQSDDQARARIDRLAASPALRRTIGQAARRAALDIVRAQHIRVRAFYLGVSVNV